MSAWIKVKIKDNNIRLTLTVIYGRCMSAWIKVKIKTRNKDNNIRHKTNMNCNPGNSKLLDFCIK